MEKRKKKDHFRAEIFFFYEFDSNLNRKPSFWIKNKLFLVLLINNYKFYQKYTLLKKHCFFLPKLSLKANFQIISHS